MKTSRCVYREAYVSSAYGLGVSAPLYDFHHDVTSRTLERPGLLGGKSPDWPIRLKARFRHVPSRQFVTICLKRYPFGSLDAG